MSVTAMTPVLSADPPHARALATGRDRAATAWLAGAVIALWAFSLGRSIFDPIGYDQALYQYMAERVMAGDQLYVDVWDQNGPGIVLIHWISTRLVGASPVAFRLFDAGWQLLTMLALMALVLRNDRRWSAAWLAAGLYVLSYYSLGYVQTGQREGFAVLPLLLSVHLVAYTRAQCASQGLPIRTRSRPWARFVLVAVANASKGILNKSPQHDSLAGASGSEEYCPIMDGGIAVLLRCAIAGVLGLFVFAIKPPLGLCFGVLWIRECVRFWRNRREGWTALAGVAGLTAGFVLAAAVGVAWLMHLGSWDGFWGVLSRRDMPGYILGPALIRSIAPSLAIGTLILIGVTGIMLRITGTPTTGAWASLIGAYAFLLTARCWAGWQHMLMLFAGLWIPAAGTILLRAWQDRSQAWRLCVLMLAASCSALILQGQFFLYHLPPLLAFAAMLSAIEIDERLLTWPANGPSQSATSVPLAACPPVHDAQHAGPTTSASPATCPSPRRAQLAWTAVCLGGVACLAVSQWWPTMAFVTSRPYVLSGTTLAQHYTSITKHKLSCPTYATTIKAADRIRTLTGENDPIACLLHDARIFYFARRPSVYKLIAMQDVYQHLFPAYMQAIRDRRPKVIVARIPDALRPSHDLSDYSRYSSALGSVWDRHLAGPNRQAGSLSHKEGSGIANDNLAAIEAAIFNETEKFFGPPGRAVRELYHATETIDDLCILQPK
jgi:hypothetical protein